MERDKQENNRESDGRWKKGMSGNLRGRPIGKTMKEWAREFLARMTDEERDEWIEGIPKEIVWKMSEGNPETKTDITTAGKPIIQVAEELLNKHAINISPEDNSK